MKVLIIEDDRKIAEAISMAFEFYWPGVSVVTTMSGNKGVEMAESESPDIIILDLNLPDISGFNVLKQVRLFSVIPVVIVTVRSEESDIVKGLELGADEYIVKPFGYMALLARVKAALRRVDKIPFDANQTSFTSDKLAVDSTTREVRIADKSVRLTPTEFKILSILTRNKGQLVTYRRLMQEVWDEDYLENTDCVRAYIRRLRSKLYDNPPQMILNQRGLGYKLRV